MKKVFGEFAVAALLAVVVVGVPNTAAALVFEVTNMQITVNGTTLHVSWDRHSGGQEPEDYTVDYTESTTVSNTDTNGSDVTTGWVSSARVTTKSHAITGLKESTFYRVRVAAHGGGGSATDIERSATTGLASETKGTSIEEHLEQASKPGMHVEGAGLRHLILEGGSFTYGIRLTNTPRVLSSPVSIAPEAVGNHRGLLTLGNSVTFPASDSRGIKSTTVTAPDDEVCKNPYTPALDTDFRPLFDPQGVPIWANQRYMVRHWYTAGGTFTPERGKQTNNQWRNWSAITFEILDDDCVGLVYSTDEVTVPEGGAATFTVRLSQPPDVGSVAFTPSLSSAAVTVTPSAVTFTKANWWKPVTFTVSGNQDSDSDDESVNLTFAAASSVSSGQWQSFQSAPLAIKVVDDETTSPQVAPQRGRVRNPNAQQQIEEQPEPERAEPQQQAQQQAAPQPGQAPPPQQPAQQPEPEPEETEQAGEPWRAYDSDESGCIESAEWLAAVHDYAAAELDTRAVLSVTRNRC